MTTPNIHTPEPVGIDGINLTASKKGLRVTLILPAWTQTLAPDDVAYWQDQIFFFDESRKMLRDLRDLTRVLRNLPALAQSEEIRTLLEHMKDFNTDAQS